MQLMLTAGARPLCGDRRTVWLSARWRSPQCRNSRLPVRRSVRSLLVGLPAVRRANRRSVISNGCRTLLSFTRRHPRTGPQTVMSAAVAMRYAAKAGPTQIPARRGREQGLREVGTTLGRLLRVERFETASRHSPNSSPFGCRSMRPNSSQGALSN